jgi:hypothetical protein
MPPLPMLASVRILLRLQLVQDARSLSGACASLRSVPMSP